MRIIFITIFLSIINTFSIVKSQGLEPVFVNINEEYLSDYPFIRVHQSYIINLNHIQNVSLRSVTLSSGAEIPVSKNNYSELIKLI
jgi:DNA-binding LytR/AlgR family response regulator